METQWWLKSVELVNITYESVIWVAHKYVLIGSKSYMTIYCNTKGTLKIEKKHLDVNLT